ncbi:uncharacterized protein LOC126901706 [Daktulosphaira vitifoliae]|uniref:uncharacterized protein LOC126901706 n=1 Tax=Daktulosphaira vitifoliae TaxID=58002 RepID=UPI0021AA16F8|nr:uncharacterized protein LOC126901706 [Daktulosphaira vitifoliae]
MSPSRRSDNFTKQLNGQKLSILLFWVLFQSGFASINKVGPADGLPFEFDRVGGSVVNAKNILTQSVTDDGFEVIKTNKQQPIKNYNYKYSVNSDGTGNSGTDSFVSNNSVLNKNEGSNNSKTPIDVNSNYASSGSSNFSPYKGATFEYMPLNSNFGGTGSLKDALENNAQSIKIIRMKPLYKTFTLDNNKVEGSLAKQIKMMEDAFPSFRSSFFKL